MSTKKKTDSEILFPEVKVEGYNIKPWTLGKIESLLPAFEKIALKLKEKGIKSSVTDMESIKKELPKIALGILPSLSEIISVTLDEKIETVKEFDLGKVTILVLAITQQNINYLKNLLSPLMPMIQEVMKKES